MPKYITKLTVPAEAIPPKGQGRSDKITFDLQIDMTPFQEMIQGLREAIAQNPGNEQRVYDMYQNRIHEVIEDAINLAPYRDRIYDIVEETIEEIWPPEPVPAHPLDPGPGLLYIRRVYPTDARFLEPVYENVYGEILVWRNPTPVVDENEWFLVFAEDVIYL